MRVCILVMCSGAPFLYKSVGSPLGELVRLVFLVC